MLKIPFPIRCINTPTLKDSDDTLIVNTLRMVNFEHGIRMVQFKACVYPFLNLLFGKVYEGAGISTEADVLETFEVEDCIFWVIGDLIFVGAEDSYVVDAKGCAETWVGQPFRCVIRFAGVEFCAEGVVACISCVDGITLTGPDGSHKFCDLFLCSLKTWVECYH
jgi:hypothetical protein